jgi:hypothetical protein
MNIPPTIRLPRCCRRAALWLPLLMLAACGGGGDAPPPPEQPAAVARVEITPRSVLLTGGVGTTQALSAQAYDAEGRPLDVPVTWSSSRAAQIAVDGSGRVAAQAAAGSAQISASAGGVQSPPVLALAATPAAGVLLIEDTQIVGDAADSDANAEPNADNTYQVTLTGVPAPAVGTLLMGRGDKPLAGRVTAVAAMGAAQTLVTLQPVPLADLLPDVELDEVFALTPANVTLPPEVAAQFDVVREGNTWRFTPKPGATTSTSARERRSSLSGTVGLLPFRDCKFTVADFSTPPVRVDSPRFALTIAPRLEARYTRASGLERLVVAAEPEVEFGANLKATAKLAGDLKCKLQLLRFTVPIGGVLSMFIGGVVPVGVGFEWSGATEFASFTVGAKAKARAKAHAGIACVALAGCDFVHDITDTAFDTEPVFELPGIGDQRLASKLKVFGTLEGEFGSPLLRSLRFKTFEARAGGTLDGKFAPPVVQVLDAGFAAEYKALLYASAQVATGIDELIRLLSLGSVRKLGLERDTPLAGTPKLASVAASPAAFAFGDTVQVTVELNPATLNFLPGLYNVESVELRRASGSITTVIDRLTASPGQTRFDFSVAAPHAGEVSQWHVFVTTRLLPFEQLSLELGPAGAGGPPALLVQSSSTMADLAGFGAAPCFGSASRTPSRGGRTERGEMMFVGANGDGKTNCLAAVAGVTAGISAQVSLSGPPVGATPLASLPATFGGSADLVERLELQITDPAAAWRQVAQANARTEVNGGWVFVASGAPVAYTVSLSAGGEDGVWMSMSAEAGGQTVLEVFMCPRQAATSTNQTFKTSYCKDSSDSPGAVASGTASGVLLPGQALRITAGGMVEWQGYAETSDFGTAGVGESGVVRSGGSMSYHVTFSAPP